MTWKVSPARPQPRSSMRSANQKVTRSGSGATYAPYISTSSPVLAMTTRSSPATSAIPRASFAPPVPPARTTTGERESKSMRARTITCRPVSTEIHEHEFVAEGMLLTDVREIADERKLRFDVEVRDGDRTIGVGTHERRVVGAPA